MKKILCAFLFTLAALYCFAQENLQSSENEDVLSLSSTLSLPLFSSDSIFIPQSSIIGNSVHSLYWGKQGFNITPYGDYDDEPFIEKATPTLQIIAIVGGVLLFLGGAGVLFSGGETLLGAGLMGTGVAVWAGGFVWILLD